MFDKIAFIHYCTRDLNRALIFYRDVLGLELRVQNEEWIEFDVSGQRLALRQVNALPSGTAPPHPLGAMIWLEAIPIEQSLSYLSKKNISIIDDLEVFSYGKTATFVDPDGNLIGLYEPPDK